MYVRISYKAVLFYCFIVSWDQYDGVIQHHPSTKWFHKVTNILLGDRSKKMQENARAAVRLLLPSLTTFLRGESNTDQDVLQKIDQICDCVKHNLYNDDYHKVDSSKLQQVRSYIPVFIYIYM